MPDNELLRIELKQLPLSIARVNPKGGDGSGLEGYGRLEHAFAQLHPTAGPKSTFRFDLDFKTGRSVNHTPSHDAFRFGAYCLVRKLQLKAICRPDWNRRMRPFQSRRVQGCASSHNS